MFAHQDPSNNDGKEKIIKQAKSLSVRCEPINSSLERIIQTDGISLICHRCLKFSKALTVELLKYIFVIVNCKILKRNKIIPSLFLEQ